MIQRIDHVSIAVRDLARAKAFFEETLGAREVYCETLSEHGFRWTTLEWGSSCLLELIDPVGEDGFLHRFLDRNGDGMHHITVQVPDAKQAQAELEARGVPTFGYSEQIPGWKEFFIHPKVAFGTLIQFAEFNPLDWVYPGYVPHAYREFAPAKAGPVEVRTAKEDEETVEIADGASRVKVAREDLPELIRKLQDLSD